ncbi:MAG: type II secretion system ATPase GspE [Hydrogenovibrio sp.]|uniref:type II secretion system ATPase GspE n=1 Tax=Hydrogenovibrio sp. TaxID=2065821 RepID=UPI0028706153|nr:type II secretion system ATPase GspE [Hydrogenovibrio sp.]MDR9499551.1 type II secretion system ATPase GspE [Hydrogenovibrio sp.]
MSSLDSEPVSAPSLSFAFARKYSLLLDTDEFAGWQLVYGNETPVEALLEVQRLAFSQGREELQCRHLPNDDIASALERHYAVAQSDQMAQAEQIDLQTDLKTAAAEVDQSEDLLDANDDAPIIKLLNAILSEAIRSQASDIHIEPFETFLRVRFRLDGHLQTMLNLKRSMSDMLVSRIKVMTQLDIAEKRLPQDGRMATKLGGRAVDLRVSTIPSSFGERVVMRLLDKNSGRLSLSQIGLGETRLSQMQSLLNRPHGIFLVTGPTGSGKTTTLYAGLSEINDQSRNIMTVEDPVEYNLEGISQTQVNTKAHMTFAKGLRAILRQDPDVVMVGEIRDQETADIAIQSSLTGHMVLSTLHTNTAVGAITRLRDMGVEPFLLASSLMGVLAQRLVRKLCQHCKEAYEPDAAEKRVLGIEQNQQPTLIHRPCGCEQCHQTGYQGRLGVYELVMIDSQMRQMIHDDRSEKELSHYAHQSMASLEEHGLEMVLAGTTSLEEVLRVIQTSE